MGRPASYPRDTILSAARGLAAERGPAAVTVAALAHELGAPTGSLYHRYPSRDVLLADLWLSTVEAFQPAFLACLAGDEPIEAGLAAIRFACRWVRESPDDARLLLVHRREDFTRGEWPQTYRQRALDLRAAAEESLRTYCRRLYGKVSARGLRRVRFALEDIPQGAFRASIGAGESPSGEVEAMVLSASRHALQEG